MGWGNELKGAYNVSAPSSTPGGIHVQRSMTVALTDSCAMVLGDVKLPFLSFIPDCCFVPTRESSLLYSAF